MSKRPTKKQWKVEFEKSYVYGREERLQVCYETILSITQFRTKKELKNEGGKDMIVCKSVQRKAGSGEDH
jgi:hypothetical protein